MTPNSQIADHLVKFLEGGQSHIKLDDALRKITFEVSGKRIEGLPYTIWQLLQHIRFAQFDIVDFSRNPSYEEFEWPTDYWPATSDGPSDKKELNECIEAIIRDRDAMIDLVRTHKDQLLYQIPHGTGQTLMREVLILVEHNAHHLGQIIVMMRILGAWK